MTIADATGFWDATNPALFAGLVSGLVTGLVVGFILAGFDKRSRRLERETTTKFNWEDIRPRVRAALREPIDPGSARWSDGCPRANALDRIIHERPVRRWAFDYPIYTLRQLVKLADYADTINGVLRELEGALDGEVFPDLFATERSVPRDDGEAIVRRLILGPWSFTIPESVSEADRVAFEDRASRFRHSDLWGEPVEARLETIRLFEKQTDELATDIQKEEWDETLAAANAAIPAAERYLRQLRRENKKRKPNQPGEPDEAEN